MKPQLKQFTGFLSSSADPGSLSLTVSSIAQAILSAGALYAVAKGLDATQVTNQLQQLIDLAATGVTASLTVYHSLRAMYGLIRKYIYHVAATPVVTQPAIVGEPILADTTAS